MLYLKAHLLMAIKSDKPTSKAFTRQRKHHELDHKTALLHIIEI